MNLFSKILFTGILVALVTVSAGCARKKAVQESGLKPFEPAERVELGSASAGTAKSGYQAPYSK